MEYQQEAFTLLGESLEVKLFYDSICQLVYSRSVSSFSRFVAIFWKKNLVQKV